MKSLYLILDLGSMAIPFIFSFHSKIKFNRYFKSVFLGIALTMAIFIPWDVYFTQHGFWGFNDQYLIGKRLLGLPIEEWLFFICIPFACIFTHFCLTKFYPGIKLSSNTTRNLTIGIIIISAILCLLNTSRAYTFTNYLYAVILLSFTLIKFPTILQQFYLTFIVILLPFFVVNGLLTGSAIESQVVWYNNEENLGIRLLTIPVEDIMYAFTMLLTCYIPVHIRRTQKPLYKT
ncbi:lycopene cyclase domain-containing protein [Zhouia amylolytica]|uniref:Lycopene cyclase domain-containing protein n=1 Tax=Zhouia amylolytica TaxID=376730 RepID=A0A1I6RU22_9FLAO|nr:lycopene cyclase domain-containing protein [Zhouia amylolytica]SFS68090.1 lycopene cyclase domain-containing protein [Zhouia amylolytica]